MRVISLVLVLGLPLAAQMPDEAMFIKDPQGAMLACADRAVTLKRDGRMLAQAGRAYLLAGQTTKGAELLAAAEKKDSSDAETYRLIASAWIAVGKKEPIPALVEKALLRDSRAKNYFAQFASDLMDVNMVDEAEKLFQVAYTLKPSDWQNIVLYTKACIRNKRQDIAAKWWAAGMREERKEPLFWNDIALTLADQGVER